jgi:hypothetical protein
MINRNHSLPPILYMYLGSLFAMAAIIVPRIAG